jgi:hypothetical protein
VRLAWIGLQISGVAILSPRYWRRAGSAGTERGGPPAGTSVSRTGAERPAQFGVEVDGLTATARCTADLAGLLGVDDTVPDLQEMSVDIKVVSSSPDERIEAIQQAGWTDARSIWRRCVRMTS